MGRLFCYMAANTDKFKKGYKRWVGQIGAGGVSDGTTTTIPLASVTNLPTDTAVVLVIDRVDANGTATPSSEETIVGVVSGSNIVNAVRGAEGTAQAHNAGAVVELLFAAKSWNDLIDGLLVEHDQLGHHTNISACNITASGTSTLPNITASGTVTASHVSACDIAASTSIAATKNVTASAVGSPTATLPLDMLTGWYQPRQSYTPSASGTATLDLALGNDHDIAMPAGNITIALSHEKTGMKFLVSLTQDSSGSRTVTWFTTIKWAGGSAPTLTTTANKRDVFGFLVTGSGTYDGFVVGQNI